MTWNNSDINKIIRTNIFSTSQEEYFPPDAVTLNCKEKGYTPYNQKLDLGEITLPNGGFWVGPQDGKTPATGINIFTNLPVVFPKNHDLNPDYAKHFRGSYSSATPQARGSWLMWLSQGTPEPEKFPHYVAAHTRALFDYIRLNILDDHIVDEVTDKIRSYNAIEDGQLPVVKNLYHRLESGLEVQKILKRPERLLVWTPNLDAPDEKTAFISAAQIGMRAECHSSIPTKTILHFLLHEQKFNPRNFFIPGPVMREIKQNWTLMVPEILNHLEEKFGKEVRITTKGSSILPIPQEYLQIGVMPQIAKTPRGWWYNPWTMDWAQWVQAITYFIQAHKNRLKIIQNSGLLGIEEEKRLDNESCKSAVLDLQERRVITLKDLSDILSVPSNKKITTKKIQEIEKFLQTFHQKIWSDRNNPDIVLILDEDFKTDQYNAIALCHHLGIVNKNYEPDEKLKYLLTKQETLKGAKLWALCAREDFDWNILADYAAQNPEKIEDIEKIFKRGPGEEELHKLIHRQGQSISEDGRIDLDKLKNLRHETSIGAKILHERLSEEEITTPEITPEPIKENNTPKENPIQTVAKEIFEVGKNENFITLELMKKILEEKGLTLHGGVDAINDQSVENGGDTALIEEGDGYEIDLDMLKSVWGEEM